MFSCDEQNSEAVLDLNRWPIFSLLEDDFRRTIKVVCVFGSTGSEAIMVTKDDDVYAMGTNNCGCLGIGDLSATMVPKRVEQLCGVSIKEIAYGTGPHCVTLTEEGEVWVWGHNCYCQLGIASSVQQNIPVPLSSSAFGNGKAVKQIACGGHHTMALTFDGEAFAWGQNNCGQLASGSTSNLTVPRKVNPSAFGNKQVTQVACGQAFSMVVLETGEVYGWGYNSNSQLGNTNSTNQTLPNKVQALDDVQISKIACGISHCLAISVEGKLYSWGSNSCGQLGMEDKENRMIPTKIKCQEGRFVEVGAIHYNHMSAAMTLPGRVFMWGQCRGQVVTTPVATPFTTLQEVFACFGNAPITHKPLSIVHSKMATLKQDIAKSFNDPTTADIKLVVEGEEIHAHKSILSIRCEYFRNMFQSEWLESSKEVVEIKEFSCNVFRAFIRYLYTDELDVKPEEALGLLHLSDCYCFSQLKETCQTLTKSCVNKDNVMTVYGAAIKLSAQELEDYCFRYAINHLTAVVETKAYEELDGEIIKEFFQKAAKQNSFRN